MDETGLVKLNPLFAWPFAMVDWHITDNEVPRNKLLDQGYRSVGDWHSTVKVAEGQDERAGRWAGQEKTECGLHKDYFAMKAQAKRAVRILSFPSKMKANLYFGFKAESEATKTAPSVEVGA